MTASLTVEAAFVLPIFVFAIAAFLYFFQVILLQQSIQSALNQTAGYFTKNAYFYEKVYEEVDQAVDEDIKDVLDKVGVNDFITGMVYKQKFKSFIDEEQMDHSIIVGGMKGISVHSQTDYFTDDELDLTAFYECRMPILFFKVNPYVCIQRVSMKNWTGYEVAKLYTKTAVQDKQDENQEKSDDIVYMTDHGTRYHTHRDCTHLTLSIHDVSYGSISELRNKFGAKYTACDSCARHAALGSKSVVYITDQGSHYHVTRNCRDLIRYVKEIPRSKVPAGTPLCKRCEKRDQTNEK